MPPSSKDQLINGFNLTSLLKVLKTKGLVLSFRFLDADKRAWISPQSGDNYRAKWLNNTYILKCVTFVSEPGPQIQIFALVFLLIRVLNNVCQVINRAFPVKYHDSRKLSRLQKRPKRPEMHEQLVCFVLKHRAFTASAVSQTRVKNNYNNLL